MQNKFLTLVENNITRYTNGGMLIGDIVTLASNYKSDDAFKELPKDVQSAIEDFFKSNDLNKRIVNIKTYYPTSAPNNDDNRGNCFTVEVAAETAPGRYDKEHKITVPSSVLVIMKPDGSNLPPVPSSLKKKERRTLKPVPYEEDEEMPNNPYVQTMMSQDGDKLTRGDRKLLNQNIKIPSNTVKSPMVVKGFTSAHKPLPATL